MVVDTHLQVARILHELAVLVALDGESSFKVTAYENASKHVAATGKYTGPGIGASIGAKIQEILQTGKCEKHRALMTQYGDAIAFTRMNGIGPSKAREIQNVIGSLKNLVRQFKQGRLAMYFSGSLLEILQRELPNIDENPRVGLGDALDIASPVKAALAEYGKVEYAGSVRRKRWSIGDVDMLYLGVPQGVEVFRTMGEPGIRGKEKVRITREGLQIDLLVVPKPKMWGSMLAYFTGSKEHNIAMRARAKIKGFLLNEKGLFNRKGGNVLKEGTEEEIYRRLGLQFVEPSDRIDGRSLKEA